MTTAPEPKARVTALERMRFGRYGPTVDPKGWQVVYRGNPYDVQGCRYRDLPAGWVLILRTFNGEHRVEAPVYACEVLERTYDP